MTRFYTLLVLLTTIVSAKDATAQAKAQYDPNSPYFSPFCDLMKTLCNMSPSQMVALGDAQNTNDSTLWRVQKEYCFPEARFCMIETKNGVRYKSIVMVRDSREQLKSSYNNLVNQVNDCLIEDALIKEKKLFNKDLYHTTITPGMPEEMPFGVEMQIAIELNLRTMLHELVFIIIPASESN